MKILDAEKLKAMIEKELEVLRDLHAESAPQTRTASRNFGKIRAYSEVLQMIDEIEKEL